MERERKKGRQENGKQMKKFGGMDGREGEQRGIENRDGESEMRKEIGRRQKMEREGTVSQ